MQKFIVYFGLLMSILIMGGAVFVMLNPPPNPVIAENKYIVGIILFLYGLFRLYRSIRLLRGKGGMMN